MLCAALLLLAQAHATASRLVYNVTSFSLSADQVRDRVLTAFPEAAIAFVPDVKLEAIVDGWPADIDDSAARMDWNWAPEYDVERAFSDYLIPNIRERYATTPP